MTADPNDLTIEGRLDQIADTMETRAGTDPGALRDDWTVPAILQRINDAIDLGGFDLSHGKLSGLNQDDHPQYLLADGTRDLTGTLTVTETCDDDLSEGWNGSIIESPVITVTSDGVTILLHLQAAGGGDLTCRFGGKSYVFDTTPATSIALAVGTDTIPVQSWIWLSEASGTVSIETNTTGWPATPFCPIATVICQSPASLQTEGAYKVHAWTDHVSKETENGHISHLNRKIRRFPANWDTGTEAANMVVSDPDAYLGCALGTVFQLHNHNFPALQMPADPVYVVNDAVTPYLRITTLDDIDTDASGGTVNNKYVNLVLWGSVNEAEGDCKLYLNLPTDTYNTAALAISDAQNYSVYDIPADFVGCGFLIARYVVQGKTTGAWVQSDKIDLRGLLASTSAGGTGTGATVLDDLGDVTLSGPVDAEVLRHDGVDWKNAALQLPDLSDVQFTYPVALGDSILNLRNPGPGWNTMLVAQHHDALVWRNGTKGLTADWPAGNFDITAKGLRASNTTGDVSEDTIISTVNVTDTGTAAGRVYRAMFVDIDYTYSGIVDTNNIVGFELDMDLATTGATSGKPQAIKAIITNDANTAFATGTSDLPFVFRVENNRTTQAFLAGAISLQLDTGTTSGGCVSTQSFINGAGSGDIIAYLGYAQCDSGFSGSAVGLKAFIAGQNTAASLTGVSSLPKSLGTFPANDLIMSYYGGKGHWLASEASLFVTSTNRATPNAVPTTHLTPTNFEGAGYFEGLLEVDGTLFMDGDLDHNGTNIGFFGTAPVAQAAAYTPTNVTPDRSYDANSTTVAELADVLGTLIADLQAYGLLQ